MDSADRLNLGQFLSRCTFDPAGTAVRCGVSGGADSLALLILAVESGLNVTAVHVDHGLRAGSNEEASLVEAHATSLGAGFESVVVEIGEGSNLEERARQARLEALGPNALTGHTADDQAETVLLQLMWGAGPNGIGAMQPGPSKPLLGLRRSDTETVCQIAGVQWFQDPSNTDPRFRRNRVRSELLPLMSEIADRDMVPLLVRSAELSRSTSDAVDLLLPEGDPRNSRWLQTLEPSIAALKVRTWLSGELGRPISADATERVMAVVQHVRKATELDGGVRLSRSDGRLHLDR